jgi:DNA-binding NarL/FixJ family response regulator
VLSAPRGSNRTSVLVVTDEELLHWGLRALLTRQAWSGDYFAAPGIEAAVPVVERRAPKIAVIDVGVLGEEPAADCRRLMAARPGLRIVLLSAAGAMSSATVRAHGAVGFVSRAWPARDLVQTIQGASVSQPQAHVSAPGESTLSTRQQEVLHLIAEGETNPEIARRLFLSHNTVKQHTSALYRKLGVKNRTHAVQAARRQGLIGA